MALQEQVVRDLREAVKARATERVSTLRLLMAQLTNEELALRKRTLSDEETQRIIQREVKKRKEAAAGFRAGNRFEASEREDAERAILEAYLPVPLSDAEVEKVVREVLTASGGVSLGKVVGAVMAKVRGRADGARVRALVESILSS